jgi:hypothetical protein
MGTQFKPNFVYWGIIKKYQAIQAITGEVVETGDYAK